MLLKWLQFLLLDGLRYLVPASVAFLVFWVWGRERFRARLIPAAFPRAAKMLHDVRWSACTIVIFATFGVGVFYGGRAHILRRYDTVAEHGWPWFFATVAILIVLQDAYFYWTHRAMHHPRLYKLFHRTHHMSTDPSPWTAYAFAPLEAVVHALFVPLVWLFLPMHEIAVFLFLVFMIVRNVLGHLSMELYPSGFTRRSFAGISTTTTHHALHHRHFRSNYGLYFTFWDRLMGTEHPDYHQAFERIAAR